MAVDRATPLRNRVTPLGELVADPGRGLVYGNRGCLHDAEGRVRRQHAGRRWIACRLEFRGRRRPGLMLPGRSTELFFLDEATALAAGHRPCAECRREDHRAFRAVWATLHPQEARAPVGVVDARLHAERLAPDGGRPARGAVDVRTLPDGAFGLGEDGEPWLVLGDMLLRHTPGGYADHRPRRGSLAPITPPSLLALLHAGWAGAVPLIHPSARQRQLGSGS